MRELARRLASSGLARVKKGAALNVRRRENVRRTLQEAGDPLGWAEIAALSDDPLSVAEKDVKKMVRSGVRSLDRSVSSELAEKKAERKELEKLIKRLEKMAEDDKIEYPVEITYTRTAKGHGDGPVSKEETLELESAQDALDAAKKIERSLPKWTKLRDEVVEELKRKQENLKEVRGNVSDLTESWRGLLKDVLVTIR